MNLRALLALFVRSIREDTRSKALFWARVGIAAAVLFAMFRARIFIGAGGAPGLAFFSSVVWMNFVFICIAAVSYFASSITEEKEEGTLGLLRMTDLSPVAILLGKSTSRLLGGLLLLLVQVPFVLLAITLGGVRLDQVYGCYAILGAFLFFACNVGLLGSVLGRHTGAAAVVTALLGVAYLHWPFLAVQLYLVQWEALDALVLTFSTQEVLETLLENRGAAISIGPALLALVAGGLGAFGLSWLVFERFCGDEKTTSRSAGSPRKWAGGSPLGRAGRAWSDAICWRDYYYLHGGSRAAVAKGLVYLVAAVWLYRGAFSNSNWGPERTPIFFMTLFGFASVVATLESLFATSRIYRIERKEKTLSSLMVLPGYLEDVMKAKRRAVIRALIPVLCFVVIPLLVSLGHILEGMAGPQFIWVVQIVAFMVAQLYFNHVLVAWFSLRMGWGGFPLALGISWIANSFAIFVAALMFQFAAVIVLIIVTILVTVSLRNALRRRLEAAASED